jgi:hypothetical protein
MCHTLDHPPLELANLFRPQIFGQFAKVLGETIDVVGVRIDGPDRQIADQHVFGHAAWLG